MQQTQTGETLSVPRHIAIIMDGNRRWATAQGKPAMLGHTAGVDRLENLITEAKTRGVEYLTIYAFSTENWRRAEEEVGHLLFLIESYAQSKLRSLRSRGVRVRVAGQFDRLPDSLQRALNALIEQTAENNQFTLILCLSYGGRDEIIRAITRAARSGELASLTEESFRSYLDVPDVPDPELVIRTSGEQRLSNFLTWQSVYSELYFTPVPWPAFDEGELQKALGWYQRRDRRFGQ